MEFLKRLRIFNGNTLKILAAIFMVVDHFGVIFFPKMMLFRYIGRLSMPIFAFMISEGCRYTKNKWKHFGLLFGFAAVCQVVYFFFDNGSLYMSILVTFSLSTIVIYAMQYFKKCHSHDRTLWVLKILSSVLLIGSIFGVYFICNHLPHLVKGFSVDYGFWGCMLPVFASIFDFRRIPAYLEWKKLDVLPARILSFTVGLLLFQISSPAPSMTIYMFYTIPLLLLYNGEKGKHNIKYFFYIFYPTHLVLLEGAYIALRLLHIL